MSCLLYCLPIYLSCLSLFFSVYMSLASVFSFLLVFSSNSFSLPVFSFSFAPLTSLCFVTRSVWFLLFSFFSSTPSSVYSDSVFVGASIPLPCHVCTSAV
uniref:Uncharacterized protein n=1 Tax=Cacopsylla melanoneura TaxID=428564 RepID=A0A8D8QCM3_9HEMI